MLKKFKNVFGSGVDNKEELGQGVEISDKITSKDTQKAANDTSNDVANILSKEQVREIREKIFKMIGSEKYFKFKSSNGYVLSICIVGIDQINGVETYRVTTTSDRNTEFNISLGEKDPNTLYSIMPEDIISIGATELDAAYDNIESLKLQLRNSTNVIIGNILKDGLDGLTIISMSGTKRVIKDIGNNSLQVKTFRNGNIDFNETTEPTGDYLNGKYAYIDKIYGNDGTLLFSRSRIAEKLGLIS